MDPDQICQILDYSCTCAPKGFDKKFTLIAGTLDIKLAPQDDQEKDFGTSTKGLFWGCSKLL